MEWKFSSDKIVQNDQNKWDRKVSAMTRHFPNVKVEGHADKVLEALDS